MRTIGRRLISPSFRKIVLLLALCGSGHGQAADLAAEFEMVKNLGGTPATRTAAVAEGKNNASFCANCHGETGNSKYPEVPNLAGQNPDYLLTQMKKFETGARKDDFMQRLIKVLGDRERATIALYYADSTVVPARPRPGPTASQGAAHFTKLCAHCHGPQARGSETIPRLAGQQARYLRVSLDRYRSANGDRVFPLMTMATSQIPATDVDAVIDYLASLK